MFDNDTKIRFEQTEYRGELRLMALCWMLRRYGVEFQHAEMIWWPAPQYQWIKRIQFFTRRWNALQAWVFIKATCNFPEDGLPCEITITGKHEFLSAGNTMHQGQVFI